MTAGTTFSAVVAMDEEEVDKDALALKLRLILEVGFVQWCKNEELDRERVVAMDAVGRLRRIHLEFDAAVFHLDLLWDDNSGQEESHSFLRTISGSFGLGCVGRVRPKAQIHRLGLK